MENKDILFKKVKCSTYLKKISDGRYIEVTEGDIAEYVDTNDKNFNLECECCGDLDFLKTYYKAMDKEFSGVVVGIKDILVSAYLVANTLSDWQGCEYLKISRVPKETVKCAIVYYGNNRKRYVPLESIKAGD